MTPPPTVVFDFDLTLTRWDTADRFFRFLLRRDPWRLAVVVVALPALAPMWLAKPTRKWPVRFAVWAATLGRGVRDLKVLVQEHLHALPGGPASAFLPPAVARLREHVAQGDRVVIATGCLEPLASALLAHAGLGDVALVASTLRPRFGGLASDQHCFGRNKIPMLEARGFAPPWRAVYTDHHADLPILALGHERWLVSPRAACLERIRRELPGEPRIVAWR